MKNKFMWSDLSTFDLDAAKRFYQAVFGWEFVETPDQSMKESYWVAQKGDTPVSGVFVMPEFLQKLNLPSFWMSYIRVKSVAKTVEKAQKHKGVIIEVGPTHFDATSKIALIRDPSGAGFTVYEGPDMQGRFATGHGKLVGNVHHVNNIDLIKPFYEDVFGWEILPKEKKPGVFEITSEGAEIAQIEVISDAEKGKFQYWIPIFGVDDGREFEKKIKSLGGISVAKMSNGRAIYADTQGASFMIQPQLPKSISFSREYRWKTVLALVVVFGALWFDLAEAVFAVLFLWWSLRGIRSRQVHLVEDLSRDANPVLFWMVSGLYIGLSILVLYSLDLFHN